MMIRTLALAAALAPLVVGGGLVGYAQLVRHDCTPS